MTNTEFRIKDDDHGVNIKISKFSHLGRRKGVKSISVQPIKSARNQIKLNNSRQIYNQNVPEIRLLNNSLQLYKYKMCQKLGCSLQLYNHLRPRGQKIPLSPSISWLNTKGLKIIWWHQMQKNNLMTSNAKKLSDDIKCKNNLMTSNAKK